MKAFLSNLFTRIRLTLVAFFKLPLVADLIEFLGRQSVLTLITGVVSFVLIPALPIANVDQGTKNRAGEIVFWGTLILVGRFSLEGIMETRSKLPTTAQGYASDLLQQLLTALAQPKQPELKG